ncbi:MAG TPA: hypothetical protein VID73_01935, partial [Ktedonobacterales bacterium]
MTGAATPTPKRAARSLGWRVPVAALLAVLVVFGATLAGRAVVGSLRRGVTLAAPALGSLRAVAATAPGVSYEHIALDSAAGRLVALSGPMPRGCPPTGPCALAAALDAFVVLDSVTGATLASTPLTGAAASAVNAMLLFADPSRHLAYAVAPGVVDIFSTASGALEASYALPGSLSGALDGGALDATHSTLLLAGGGTLVAVNAATGAVLASRPLP